LDPPPFDAAQQVPLPCTVNTYGYGDDHDANLLQAIAESGRGIYYHLANNDVIADAFSDCLGGLLSVVAKDIKMTFRALNGTRIKQVLSKYRQREIEAGTVIELVLADLQVGV
jgi:hypothetical protein